MTQVYSFLISMVFSQKQAIHQFTESPPFVHGASSHPLWLRSPGPGFRTSRLFGFPDPIEKNNLTSSNIINSDHDCLIFFHSSHWFTSFPFMSCGRCPKNIPKHHVCFPKKNSDPTRPLNFFRLEQWSRIRSCVSMVVPSTVDGCPPKIGVCMAMEVPKEIPKIDDLEWKIPSRNGWWLGGTPILGNSQMSTVGT